MFPLFESTPSRTSGVKVNGGPDFVARKSPLPEIWGTRMRSLRGGGGGGGSGPFFIIYFDSCYISLEVRKQIARVSTTIKNKYGEHNKNSHGRQNRMPSCKSIDIIKTFFCPVFKEWNISCITSLIFLPFIIAFWSGWIISSKTLSVLAAKAFEHYFGVHIRVMKWIDNFLTFSYLYSVLILV